MRNIRNSTGVVIVLTMMVAAFVNADDTATSTTSSMPTRVDSYACRRGERKATMLKKHGGTKESEAAVAAALDWLVAHQNTDGSWNFNHQMGACKGRCGNPGDCVSAQKAATSMALLALLGSGHTHKAGDYQPQVKAGLQYLIRGAKPLEDRLSFIEKQGTMYSHGLVTLALCEAVGMTGDEELKPSAQAALNFIAYAQDPLGGGWRYAPKQAGDLSLSGWQIAALRAGEQAGLSVPPETKKGAQRFLDLVGLEGGAYYGYTTPAKRPSTTAIGLLSRDYLGGGIEGAIEKGAAFLASSGPSKQNLYYNYYATAVMREHGGDGWPKWNTTIREHLIASQETEGHEAGSWKPGDDLGSNRGGRLYATAMSALILETYYRNASE